MATRPNVRVSLWMALAGAAVILALAVALWTQSAAFDTLAGRNTPAPPIARLVDSGPLQGRLEANGVALQPNPRVRFGADPITEPNPRVKF
jgi:hypothetical protein